MHKCDFYSKNGHARGDSDRERISIIGSSERFQVEEAEVVSSKDPN